LWEPLLLNWVRRMRRSHSDIALRVHVDVPQDLIDHVAAGIVDIAIMYAPQHRPGLKIDLVMEEELVLVTTDAKAESLDASRYVLVEWGQDFSLHHEVTFPETTPTLVTNLGPLALSYVLLEGGAGYFRMHAVKPYLMSGDLHIVSGAPQFSFPIYAVHSANVDEATLASALAALREVSTAEARD
jgi:LysR family transcriptional regulator, flagellar master operon regulator